MKHVALSLLLLSSVAQADALPDGAPVYLSMRPLSAMALAKRLGANELPAVQQLKQQLGGIDVLDPMLLAPTGLDVAAPIRALFELAGPNRAHIRVVAEVNDPAMFGLFLGGLTMAKQLPIEAVAPDSPLGKKGILATTKAGDGSLGIARLDGTTLVVDLYGPARGSMKPAQATELLKKYPLKATRPFSVEHGARKLFSPDAAVVIYADGKRLLPLVDAFDDKPAPPKCMKEWSQAPGAFDDVALALGVDPDGISAQLAWGADKPTLQLKALDDDAYDLSVLKTAPATLAIYAASLQPFASLKRSGPLATQQALDESVNRCATVAGATLLARSWPQAIGAALAGATNGNGAPIDAARALGQLRNVVLLLRDGNLAAPKWAVGATLDAQVKQLLDVFLAAAGAPTSLTVGKRQAQVYSLAATGMAAAVAVENLPSGLLGLTVADSTESLSWALRRATPMPGQPASTPSSPTPLVAAWLDGAQLTKLLRSLPSSGADLHTLEATLKRLRHLDARLTSDDGLFRLTVRAPVKQ